MSTILLGQDKVVGPWVAARVGIGWSEEGSAAIGLWHPDKGLVAGVLFEGFNGVNIGAHIAVREGESLTREFLWFIFHYPFEQLGASRITGIVPAANAAAKRLNMKLGFEVEATLRGAHPSGDLEVHTMWKDRCKWLHCRKV